MNFEPSRSGERRMTELQRKPNQLGMERMWRVTAHGGQESRTKDVSVFPNSGCIYFLTISHYHIVSHYQRQFSSLQQQSGYGLRVTS